MKVLVTTTWGYGHVFPVVPIARALAAAGHQVLWATHEPAVPLVQAAGLATRYVGLDAVGVAELAQRNHQQVGALLPQDRAAHAFPTMFGAGATAPMVAGLLPCAQDFEPDLIVHENAELAGPLVAALLGVPCVTHSFGGAVPPAFIAAAGERLRELWAQHGLEVASYAGCFRDGYLDLCPPAVQTVPVD
ncbi:MAG: hypothetical protein H7323_05825, partial [Frankiales bacterium]|nr:hypothetical protein [Frankiales bacterium]